MRQQYFIGNWKMYTNTTEARRLARAVVAGLHAHTQSTVLLCPPFPYLALVGDLIHASGILLGAQNVYPEVEGAFTGEVSPTMLLDLGCAYVIVGHSERRHALEESDSFINRKVLVALAAGLQVILCVGETLDQRLANQTNHVIDRQLTRGLSGLSNEQLSGLHIAYEPVWAIGSAGHHATPLQVSKEHAFIRHRFSNLFGQQAGHALTVIYGGSVNPGNAAELLGQPGIDGVLIGADSLDAGQFLAIIREGCRAGITERVI